MAFQDALGPVRQRAERLNRRLLMTTRAATDAAAMAALGALPGVYLPWSVAAMRPSALVALLNEVAINDRRQVVECGAGLSSVYLGRLLSQTGGEADVLEHDETWAERVRCWLEADGNGDRVTIHHAPLADGWYDRGVAAGLPSGIDLLSVDGPVAGGSSRARQPALPFFAERLTEDAAVLLDDSNRPGEQAILAHWTREYGLTFDHRVNEGFSLGRRTASFSV